MKYIYKYRDINKYTLKTLSNNELYFALPKQFNDPFDCKVNYFVDGTKEEIIQYFSKYPYSKEKLAEVADQILSGQYTRDKQIEFCKIFDSNVLYVLSFAEKNDNVLMWSHYSNCHYGICLEFKVDFYGNCNGVYFNPDDIQDKFREYKGFLPIQKVKYNSELPTGFNCIKDDDKKLSEFFITKADDWKYENELRIVVSKAILKNQIVRFVKKSLNGVIFGLKTTKNDIIKIYDIVKNNYDNTIKFYKASVKELSYEIEIKIIDDFDEFLKTRF